ncbi:MAG: hypothetical protein TECD_01236 [Hyphomicrobiaceae bacterium hypho_1]
MNGIYKKEPIVSAPGVVVAVIAIVSIIHLIRVLGGSFLDHELINYLALYPYRIGPNSGDVSGGFFVGMTSLITHALLHSDWIHLFSNNAWLLAFGSLIARRTSRLGFFLLFIICTICGGLTYLAINGFVKSIVIGMSGAVSGLMGASFRFIFLELENNSIKNLQYNPRSILRLSLINALQHRKTMMATGIWIAMNFLLAVLGPRMFGDGGIAWEAHLGGFLAGFLFFGTVDRGHSQY